MNLVDLIIIVIVALGGWNGYRTGLVRQVTRLFGVVIAYFVSLWLRPYVAPVIAPVVNRAHWTPSQTGPMHYLLGDFSGAIAFAGVFIITFLLLRFGAGLVDALFRLPVLSLFNRMAGLIAGLVLSIVFVYVASLVAHYVNSPPLQKQLNHSTVVQWMDAKKVPLAQSLAKSMKR